MKQSLAVILERFNRKERNLLLRDALGDNEKTLHLDAGFLKRVSRKLGITEGALASAWWATDYHIDWLAGALAVFYLDEDEAKGEPWPNAVDSKAACRLVEGNQEDVDMLIVCGHHLILVEAKAYGSWSSGQSTSKIKRFSVLRAYYEKLSKNDRPPITWHLLLISPTPPPECSKVEWPSWALRETKIPWIQLDIQTKFPVLTATRCNEKMAPDANGGHWRVKDYGNSKTYPA